jgi:hypothetical protein
MKTKVRLKAAKSMTKADVKGAKMRGKARQKQIKKAARR